MAIWGALDGGQDHAERACRATLAIAAAVAADNSARVAAGGAAIRMRIGIHTGPVVVGNIGAPGRVNYTVVGDTVNTANRLEVLNKEIDAEPTEVGILISGDTAAALGADFSPIAAGTHRVRGRQEAVDVFRLA